MRSSQPSKNRNRTSIPSSTIKAGPHPTNAVVGAARPRSGVEKLRCYGMSLSHQFDEYLAARGIEPSAEVIPDLPCHEYDHTATPNGGDADRQAITTAENVLAAVLRS